MSQGRIVGRDDVIDAMGALARRVDERTLEMQAEHARQARDRRTVRKRRLHDIAAVCDQRGQQARGAVRAMGRDNGRDALDVGLVVEHHPAAAIDLHVDETWGEDRTFGQFMKLRLRRRIQLGEFRLGEDAGHMPVANEHDGVVAHALAIE